MHILQIGDIHYPDYAGTRTVDIKDRGFPQEVVEQLAEEKLRAPLIRAASINDRFGPMITVCGDLTSRAEASSYQETVDLIKRVFRLQEGGADQAHVHVALGNHDVDRSTVSASGPISLDKYAMARHAWAPDEILGVVTPRTTHLTDGTVELHAWTMNSCVGSGEYRNMAEEVRTAIQQLVDRTFAASSSLALTPVPADGSSKVPVAASTHRLELDNVYEQLDTPALEVAHLEHVVESIRKLPHNAIPIVLAHHNLLPQAETRIDVYTELLNSGSARSRLASCGRSVIYLHGHIHSDPVEVVEQFHPSRGRVVCVSAPLLVDGFNHLMVQFSDSGRLLGLIVEPHRTQKSGDVVAAPKIRVPLVDLVGPDHGLLVGLGRVFSSDSMIVRMPNLVEQMTRTAVSGLSWEDIVDVVLEAEWLGRVIVENRDDESRFWRVRSA